MCPGRRGGAGGRPAREGLMKIIAKYAAPTRKPTMYRGSRRRPSFFRAAFLSILFAAKKTSGRGEGDALTTRP